MRIALVTAMMLAGTVGARAYCPTVPDDAGSQYVRNGARTAVCMSNELSDTTQYRNFETETRSQIDQLQRQMLQQRVEIPVYRVDPFVRTFP
jgi:hypothetical protein